VEEIMSNKMNCRAGAGKNVGFLEKVWKKLLGFRFWVFQFFR